MIPAALPWVLGLQRKTGLRSHDEPPTRWEIASHLFLWSVLFEALGPRLFRHATGDFLDVLAYAAGALLAEVWWRRSWFVADRSVRSFDALAPHYLRLEQLLAGERLQRCRLAHLPNVGGARSILILGQGPGRFLAECRRRLPEADITCVDSSARMRELAKAGVYRAGLSLDGIRFVTADALAWEPGPAAFDLVVTHFFLDCFRPDQLASLVSRIARSARGEARWLLSEFQIPPRGPARWRAQISLWLAYRFFRATTGLSARRLTDPSPYLAAAGFRLQARQESDWGLLRGDLWERRPVSDPSRGSFDSVDDPPVVVAGIPDQLQKFGQRQPDPRQK